MRARIAAVAAILGVLYWAASLLAGLRTTLALRRVADAPEPSAGDGTSPLSIVVAARDEAATLRHEADTFAALDHPDLELVLVDDRSTDGTADAMDQLAAADHRIQVLHVDALPEGWLGKVHALEQGRRVARGRWLLFTDADVELAPELPRRLVAEAERRGVQHLALLPAVHADGVLIAGCVAVFSRWLIAAGSLWRAADPDDPTAFGVGACNLVDAALLDAAGGLEWLRLDIADDAALAQLVVEHGGRSMLASGAGLVAVQWQESVASMTRGFEKYGFSGGVGTLPRTLVLVLLGFVGELAPWAAVAIAPRGSSAARRAGVATIVTSMALGALLAQRAGAPMRGVAAQPLAAALVTWMQVRAALLERRRGGVVWRDTFYATDALRAGKRFGVFGDAPDARR